MKSQITQPDHDVDGLPLDERLACDEPPSLREMVWVLGERMKHLAMRADVSDLTTRIAVIDERMDGVATKTALAVLEERMDGLATKSALAVLEERMDGLATKSALAVLEERVSHTATKTWVLTGFVTVLAAVLSGFWWIVQQYLSPLLRALAHT